MQNMAAVARSRALILRSRLCVPLETRACLIRAHQHPLSSRQRWRAGAAKGRQPSRCMAAAAPTGPSSSSSSSSMDPAVEMTVEKLHSTPSKAVVYVAGGASQAISWLLTVPGASRTVLDVRVPYAEGSMAELLGSAPANFTTPETAAAMARAAFRHAASLTTFGTDIVGIGATCALATDREKRGQHKAFVSTYSCSGQRSYGLRLAKGARTRLAEDDLASRLLLRAAATAMGVGSQELELGLLPDAAGSDGGSRPEEGGGGGLPLEQLQVDYAPFDSSSALTDLINGRVSTVEFSGGNVYVDAPRRRRIYLPGSFNPLHDGHMDLLEAACRCKPGMEGAFELSIGNADKGLLPLEEIQKRAAQFTAAGLPLVVTQAPLFTQKAELFRESVFVVGYDTAVRLVAERYYGTSHAMLLQFARLRFEGCSFLVAGRRGPDGRFNTLADIEMPPFLPKDGLFEEIPEQEFRADISSTELRALGYTAGARPPTARPG